MKLTLRFVVLVIALLSAVVASATAGWNALGRLDGALTTVVSGDMERLLAITHTRRLFRSMVVLERDYMLAASNDERKPMDAKMAKAASELMDQIEKYRRLMPKEDTAALENIVGVRARWLVLDEQVRDAARRGEAQALALANQHNTDPVSWEAVIGSLVKASETRLAAQAEATHVGFRTARTTLLWVSGIAALFAVGLGGVIFFGIRRNLNQVEELNSNLEQLVRVRTEALAARERSLRLVLDSTGDGIIGVRADGTLSGGSSAAAQRWFGTAVAGSSAAKYLFPTDENGELFFTISVEQMFEGFMPWDVVAAQAPRTVRLGDQVLELEYKPVEDQTDDVRLLVVARDVTARVVSEHAEQAAREQHGLVARLLADKQGFAAFVKDVENLIQTLGVETDPVAAKRYLHTVKGNVALFGLGSVASLCHQIEDQLEGDVLPSAAAVADLSSLFSSKLKSIEEFLTGLDDGVVEVETDDHTALIQSLIERKDYKEIINMVEVWSWSKSSEVLTRLRAQAEYVAKRLDKRVNVEVDHGDLRLPSSYLTRFWPTLVHVVRNAVDHGIESRSERSRLGKADVASVRLRTWQSEDRVNIEIADDGGGIDFDSVRAAAVARGIAVSEGTSLVDLIFRDGVSTRSEVTDLSGRGVGLSATLEACVKEGGEVSVITEVGRGTRFVFSFRRPIVKTGQLASSLERRWSLAPSSVHRATASDAPVSAERQIA